MCLILIALGAHPRYPFILAANRDEFHHRRTAPAQAWADAPEIVGGRDLEQGGTWLGMAQRGAVGAVTNYRDPTHRRPSPRSRGLLVSDFLRQPISADAHVADALRRGDEYDGFNLIVADASGVWYASNRGGSRQRLGNGIHGLSNHLLDTPWPKVRAAKTAMAQVLADDAGIETALFAVLADDRAAADEDLPDTGVGRDWERRLSPVFIRSDGYGTRASTLLLIDHAGNARLLERTFDPAGAPPADRELELQLAAPIGFTA